MEQLDKLKDLTTKIESGIKSVYESENYKKYLKQATLFHEYSARNMLLIFTQNENATRVAGYNKWLKFNRQVQKGEKGIYIIAPYKVEVKKPDENGEYKAHTMIKFKPTTVFDISQTVGEPLAEICNNLQGCLKEYDKIFQALKSLTNCQISFEALDQNTNGMYIPFQNKIILKTFMSDEQSIKTFVHELAHSILHKNDRFSREIEEIQAESVAFMVCDSLNIDTSNFSFEYIADWGKKQTIGELQSCLTDIQDCALQIITKLDFQMHELTVTKDANSKNKVTLSEKINNAKQVNYDNTFIKESLFNDKQYSFQ